MMFTDQEISRIRQTVFDTVGFSYDAPVRVTEGKGLRVEGDRQGAAIACDTLPALARGFFRLAQELTAGQARVSLCEEPRFASCGCFLDMSRHGVMTVDACKRYMDATAALGMNLIVLYTEDTYLSLIHI